jgi:hypothetical protein
MFGIVEPATVFTGWVVKTSFFAVAAEIVNELLVALVKPVLVAVTAYDATVVRDRPVKVATPFTADTVLEMPEGVEVKVTEADELATTLPLEFCTWTTMFESVAPAVALAGCVENLSWVAEVPPVTVKELLVALVRPLLLAVSVYVPAVFNTNPVKFATPLIAPSDVEMPLGLETKLTVAVDPETRFP